MPLISVNFASKRFDEASRLVLDISFAIPNATLTAKIQVQLECKSQSRENVVLVARTMAPSSGLSNNDKYENLVAKC